VEAKKFVLTSRFPELHSDRIVIVIREIESWYLAGLDDWYQKDSASRSWKKRRRLQKRTSTG
jgi:hypothetical protein